MSDILHVERAGGVAHVTLARPAVRNALNAELIAELTGFSGEIRWDASMPNGQPRRSLDASRAKELFGFEAQTPLREGLERTYAAFLAGDGRVARDVAGASA